MKLKILRNLGPEWPAGKEGKPYQEGDEADVDDAVAEKLIAAGLAEAPGGAAPHRVASEETHKAVRREGRHG